MEVPHGVEQSTRGLADGFHHPRVSMARVGDPETRAEIHVAIAVRVPNVGAHRPFPEDGGLRGELGDVLAFDPGEALRERAGARARNGTHDFGKLILRARHGAGL